MDINNLKQLVFKLAKSVDDDKKIAIPVLAAKLDKYIESYKYDQTLGAMQKIVDKMASNNVLFIKRAELRELYNKLYSRNTKFAELFQDELGKVQELPTAQIYNRDESVNVKPYEVQDKALVNGLSSVFDTKAPSNNYSPDLANTAKSSVVAKLDAWGLKPTFLDVSAGNDQFLIIKADYETPKGLTSIYIPMEISGNRLVEASLFMSNNGPQDLNNSNIKNYIMTCAGTKSKISSASILNTLIKATSPKQEINDVELALVKLNSAKQCNSEFFQNQIVGLKVAEEAVKDVELPKYDEFSSFEKQFSSPMGIAAFKFGKDKIKTASNIIVRELENFGYNNPQISISNSNDNTMYFSVSLDGRVGFNVPMKVTASGFDKPSFIICNGSISSFDKDNIQSMYINNESDYKAAAAASPMFGLTSNDLIENIKQAMKEHNLSKAEDALNILANNDKTAYAIGFGIYLSGLNGKVATASKECKCSLIIKSSSSIHPICGHTGLPIHKVYQDEYGNCRPLYRQGMDETYENVSLMHSKIFG